MRRDVCLLAFRKIPLMSQWADILDDVSVSPNLESCNADITCFCPTPCLLDDGSIVCSYRRGREKHSRDGTLVCQKSCDGGRTWLDPVVIFDGMQNSEPLSVHTGALCSLGGLRILAAFTAVEATNPNDYIFSEGGRRLGSQFYVAHSDDGGSSWTKAERTPLIDTPHNFYIGSRPFLLPNGTVFLPIEATLDGAVEIIQATVSTDGGFNWRPIWTCLADEKSRLGYGDPRFTQLPDGRLVVLVWTWLIENEQSLPVHRSVSADNGVSWSPPCSTGVASQIMTPLALDDSKMIAVSNVRTKPEGSYLWLSSDAGASWKTDCAIQMWDPAAERVQCIPLRQAHHKRQIEKVGLWNSLPGFTFGTPELLRLSDLEFLLTYYATVRGISHVRACRFRIKPNQDTR